VNDPLSLSRTHYLKKISTLAPEVVPEAPRGCEQSRSLADIGCSTIAERFQTSHICDGVLRVSILTLELGNLEAWKVLGHVGIPRLLHTRPAGLSASKKHSHLKGLFSNSSFLPSLAA